MAYQNPDGSYRNEVGGLPVLCFTPATGATIVIPSTARVVYVNPAANIAALTIKLPRSPEQGQFVDIGFGKSVTALTWQDGNGNAVSGLHSAATAGTACDVTYAPTSAAPGAPAPAWVKWR